VSLWKYVQVGITHGTHNIKAYEPFRSPKLAEKTVTIFSKPTRTDENGDAIKKRGELRPLESFPIDRESSTWPIPQGFFLMPTQQPMTEGQNWSTSLKISDPNLTTLQYELRELKPANPTKPSKPGASAIGKLAEIHMTFDCDPHYYHQRMRSAAMFLQSNRIVEFQIHVPGKAGGKEMKIKRRPDAIDPIFEWFWGTRPHFWPDVMMRAMPEGTYVKVDPYRGRDKICWVMANGVSAPKQNVTRQVENLRERHLAREEHGVSPPLKPERKAFHAEIKERIQRGEELSEMQLPKWYRLDSINRNKSLEGKAKPKEQRKKDKKIRKELQGWGKGDRKVRKELAILRKQGQ
jgi:hypothetical protein